MFFTSFIYVIRDNLTTIQLNNICILYNLLEFNCSNELQFFQNCILYKKIILKI